MNVDAETCLETVIGSSVGDIKAEHAGMSDAIWFRSSCFYMLVMNV